MSASSTLGDFNRIRLIQKGDFLTPQSEGDNNPSSSSIVVDVAKIVLAFTTITVTSSPSQQLQIDQTVKSQADYKVEVVGNIVIGNEAIPLNLELNPSKPDIMVKAGNTEEDKVMEKEQFLKSVNKLYDTVYRSSLSIFGLITIAFVLSVLIDAVPKEVSLVGAPLSAVCIISLVGFRTLFRRFFN